MPIRNEKGLAALKALSTGGSAGLNAYKQAQSAEAASRTSALQGALGGNDVAAAAQKAQAQFSPQVSPGAGGIDNLNVAAENYLSRASTKLANRQYEDQQNLALQAQELKNKQNEISEKDRLLMLQGASEAWAQDQAANAQANTMLGQQLGNLAQRKADLRNQLTAFDQQAAQNPLTNPNVAATLALNPNSPALQQLNEQAAARQTQRDEILRQMAGLDQQTAASAEQFAGMMGRDTKGLMDAYAQADQGNAQAVRDLTGFLAPEARTAAAKQVREIEKSGQSRLRDLAPAFGIDPLKAAGMFREGEGDDLARAMQRGKEQAYIEGQMSPKQRDEAVAGNLGFDNVADYKGLRTKSRMSDEEIAGALQSEEWAGVRDVYQGALTGEIPGGYAGFQSAVRDYANGLTKPEGMDDKTWKAEKAKLIQLANAYYKDPTKTAAGSDESEVE